MQLIGRALSLSGHPSALKVLESASAAGPSRAETQVLIAAEYELRRELAQALKRSDSALSLASSGAPSSETTAARVHALTWRGRALTGLARYDEASQALAAAADLAPSDVEVLLSLAHLAYVRNNLAEAEKSLDAAETAANHSALSRARLQIARAGLALERGRYREAEAGLRSGLTRMELSLGPSNRQLIPGLRNLARCLRFTGEFSASIDVIQRAVTISTTAHGAESAATAQLLGTLATARAESGHFSEAQNLYHRLLEIETKALGAQHPQVAADLYSLANLEQVLGNFDGAIGHARQSLAIREAVEGKESARTASVYAMLGRVHALNGDLPRGRELARLGVEIGRRTVGSAHPRTLFALSDLGEALILSGQAEEARAVLADSLTGMEKLFGQDSVRTAQGAYNLGLANRAARRHPEALAFFQRAARTWKKGFGDQYPLLAEALAGVAASLVDLGRHAEALEPALESASIRRTAQTSVALTAAEHEALLYAAVDRDGLELALDLAAEGRLAEADVRRVWDALLRDRASVLDATARVRRLTRTAEAAPSLLEEVARIKKNLAQAALLGEPRQYAARVSELREQLAGAERRLGALAPGLGWQDNIEGPGWEQVEQALPPDAALVAYARTPRRYVAFVLAPGAQGPWAVGLEAAPAVDTLIAAWRKQMDVERSSHGRNARRNEAAVRAAGLTLRKAVWNQVKPLLAGARAVWLVPDGALHGVNFEALPQGRDRYLLETDPPFAVLTAERDLIRPTPRQGGGGRLVALGDPAFGSQAASAVTRCASAGSNALDRLPAAAREAATVATWWTASGGTAMILTGSGATEAALKQAAPGARILHLAAHGYYLAPHCRLPREAALAAHPLLRAGVVLAPDSRGQGEDGLLTAEEVSGLSLESLELAVLSGCDTALGQSQAGEGVLGLRRAFRAAGAAWLITSLWPVEDTATHDWMQAFYRGLLVSALAPERAALAASLAQLRRLRAAGASTHPFRWAAFQAAR
ncbi:MAG: CHAT domain-containing protein [Acidobacteria bacterium]|nr:CHAT domain-containing protein [Acidobacteriota bacterium]